MKRLSREQLPAPRPGVALPPDRGLAASVGIVHLGIGAFHRAHQAVFTEDAALAADEPGWGICGVTQRSRTVVDQLRPQDGLYTVLQRDQQDMTARVVGQVSDVFFAAEEGERQLRLLAAPATRVVTLTVTEKGYRRDEHGDLDLADEAVAHDLAHDLARPGRGRAGSRSVVGQLVRGLQARELADAGPVTVLSCDNLPENGRVVQRLLADFCRALPRREGEQTAAWITEHVSCPSSMVDRIVPATTDRDRADAEALLGVRDAALVVAEPFRQWVIEDRFASARPAWERAGATFVNDVAPYERLKLRVLNGTHSMLAYLGALAGYETIAQAVCDPDLRSAARRLVADDVVPTLQVPPGVDVSAYAEEVLDRFANPALGHRTTQVAMDGSQKLPVRLLGTARDRLAAGAVPDSVALAVAGWMAYVAVGADATGRALPLDDPLARRLKQALGDAPGDARSVTDALLGISEIFGTDLTDHAAFTQAVTTHLKELL
ncbi:MAG: mannitol dehydrogenase family protein [Humibacillus sp.]|nr:mannitol dehydrogenase family protein [Humibacillus sp.]MDN5777099.1 mannitol dehydrogenase family protein [Humibacillus sp.]